jgi:hypothetical protein
MSAPVQPRKKTGKPTDFTGMRLKFLEEQLTVYTNASKKSKTREIWTKMFLQYWSTFPWRLPFKQDPDPSDPTDYALAPTDAAEEKEKAKVMETMEAVSRVAKQSNETR